MLLYYKEEPKKVYIKESKLCLLSEDVFASGIRKKQGQREKKIQLSYKKRASQNMTKNHGTLNSAELLNTGKMDQDNADTFEVPLKGGIISYNITSINGTEIMHYFKNKRSARMKIDVNGNKEEYELWMDDPEYNEFISTFTRKVGNVLKHVSKEIFNNSKKKVKFSGVSILPVPSSSDFNRVMVNTMIEKGISFGGLPVVAINHEMFKKDTSKITKDEEFISKNKDYYSSKMFKSNSNDITHEGYIDKELGRFSKINQVRPFVDAYNNALNELVGCYARRKQYKTIERLGVKMAFYYEKLYDAYLALIAKVKEIGVRQDNVYDKLKGSKSQIAVARTNEYWEIAQPYLDKNIEKMDIVPLQMSNFQIKKLSNDVRMGLKNYFSSNDDIVAQEMDKIKGTIFVIFDDNVSGGATLSDICMQAKELGIEYIVPITFGEMRTKYNLGRVNQVNKPTKSGRFERY